jgi:hypothetical protein
MKQLAFIEETFTNRSVKAVTFQGKLSLPIHRWYRLTPSFSPKLADDIANHFELGPDDFVLDPFSGVGTVPVCMKYRGIAACSIELNPYLHFVSTVKTRTYRDIDAIESCFQDFLKRLREVARQLPDDAGEYLRIEAAHIPPIQHPERWWSPGNLMQLTCLRKVLADFDADSIHLDLIRMGASAVLVPVSNAKHNHVSLTFAQKPLPTVDVVEVLAEKLGDIVDDLQRVSTLPCADATVYYGNSKEASHVLPSDREVSAVITSPPYPNRFSYARETRPHLFFNDLVENAAAVGQLETDAIGGTWGKATSTLSQGVEPANEVVASLLAPYVPDIHGKGELMAHYVTKYFNNIFEHAGEIAKVCRNRARLAYVIGNSKFYDHPLPSDEILAAIFDQFGFSLDRIDRMRKRQSKTELYEAVVFMQRR